MKLAEQAAAALVIAALCGAPHDGQAAGQWTPDDGTCGEQPTTLAIVGCVTARAKMWDGRLNQAWKTVNAMLRSDPELKARMPALKAAQLAWLRYRDANCAFYATDQGTFAQVEFANCMLDMTQARAIELQAAGPH